MPTESYILVIADEGIIGLYLSKLLEDHGYRVTIAFNGEEAIVVYQDNSADIVLVDLIMKGMDGVEIIRELRNLVPETKFILLSGVNPEELEQISHLIHVPYILSKPIEEDELMNAVTSIPNP